WFRIDAYDLARRAAIDVAAGLRSTDDESRAERIARLTDDIMNLPPGWRWVRDHHGSRKEYVPLLENPWPDWPGLREAKLREKLQCIYSRTEYQKRAEPASGNSSKHATPRPSRSPADSSPAARLKQRGKKPAAGSEKSNDASA